MAQVSSLAVSTLFGTVVLGDKTYTGFSTVFSRVRVTATTTTPARVTTSSTTPRSVTTPTVTSSSSSVAVRTTSSSSSSSALSSSTSARTAALTSRAPTTTSPTTSSTSTSIRSSSSHTSSSSSSASSASASTVANAAKSTSALSPLATKLIIAAAVVGGVVILALIVGFVMRRMRRKRRSELNDLMGSELQESPGAGGMKGGYGGSNPWASSTRDDVDHEGYGEKTLGAGAAGFGSGNFVNALGRSERPVSPLPAGGAGMYGTGYVASEVSLHGQPMGTDGINNAGMYDMEVGQNSYGNLGHGYPPSSPYHQPAPGQYFQQQQQQAYGDNAYPAYPSMPSTVALVSNYPDQSYDNLSAQAPYNTQLAPALAVIPPTEDTPAAAPQSTGTLMRVVRGFQATLADELQIQPFTTLLLLQMYDDGWCLCEDLETHAQGVVPKDCLAAPELVNGQIETGKRALTPTNAGPGTPTMAVSPPSTSNLPPTPGGSTQPAPAPIVDEKRALAAADAVAAAGGGGSAFPEAGPVPYEEEDSQAARPLPTLPPPSFSESNLFAQSQGAPPALGPNEYPREKSVATPPPRLDGLDFGPQMNSPSGSHASTSRIPRNDTMNSLAPSERQERRSSLMDSVRAAGAYLEGNGSQTSSGYAQ